MDKVHLMEVNGQPARVWRPVLQCSSCRAVGSARACRTAARWMPRGRVRTQDAENWSQDLLDQIEESDGHRQCC